MWIAAHPDLAGDPRLGPEQQQRFLPSRFDVAGHALDARGAACHELACPQCHLVLPRAMVEVEPVFLSILGAPSCGKSYFLAAMTWMLRQTLPRHFSVAFADADATFNHQLNEYEEIQFLNPDQDRLVSLRKTEEQGDLYDEVLYGAQRVRYPRPFIFTLRPLDNHPNQAWAARYSRVLCVYDNAGESFLPGADTGGAPVTRHLAKSRALLFLFDPTQDLRFRRACYGKTSDPQMIDRSERLERERPIRQDTILLEAAGRVRRHAGLAQTARHNRPLVVVVTKYDAWRSLLDDAPLEPPWSPSRRGDLCALNLDAVDSLSRRVRGLLFAMSPEIVTAAESFAQRVVYIPVSAMGRGPEVDAQSGALGIRPRDIAPKWVEVPLLYTIARFMSGIIPYRASSGKDDGEQAASEGLDE